MRKFFSICDRIRFLCLFRLHMAIRPRNKSNYIETNIPKLLKSCSKNYLCPGDNTVMIIQHLQKLNMLLNYQKRNFGKPPKQELRQHKKNSDTNDSTPQKTAWNRGPTRAKDYDSVSTKRHESADVTKDHCSWRHDWKHLDVAQYWVSFSVEIS